MLRCARPRLEAALEGEPPAAPCPGGCGVVFGPGWWCEDCGCCVFPTLLLDTDHEPNGDAEPDDDVV
jgi:hypothetical protein